MAIEALHATLVFLGATPRARVTDVWVAASRGAEGRVAPVLSAAGVEAVPRRRPRLLAVDLEDHAGNAASLQAAVVQRLAGASLHEPEPRAFWPHITFARVRGRAPVEPLALASEVSAIGTFTPSAMTLYRSEPSAKGARYSALERLRLPEA